MAKMRREINKRAVEEASDDDEEEGEADEDEDEDDEVNEKFRRFQEELCVFAAFVGQYAL